MSVQFAKDEKVIKSFNYAAIGYNKKKGKHDTFKNLIVTNKRVIHEAVRETRGNEMILRQEMPVSDAKYVKTVMGKSSDVSFLVQAIIYAVVAVAIAVLSTLEFAEKFSFVFLILAAPFAIVAIKKLVDYLRSFSNIVSFSIFTDHPVTPVLMTAVADTEPKTDADGNPKKNTKKEPALEIRVNAQAAREIADGLGAAILNAVAYTGEEDSLDLPTFENAEDLLINTDVEEDI